MKLRILFITERFKPDLGGLAQSASRIAQNLCSLDAQVDVVTWSRFLQPGEIINESIPSDRETTSQIYRIGLYRHWDLTMIHTLIYSTGYSNKTPIISSGDTTSFPPDLLPFGLLN